MWYKYVDRASYDIVRIWRFVSIYSDEEISSSTKMITVSWKTNTQDSSMSIFIELSEVKDLYIHNNLA